MVDTVSSRVSEPTSLLSASHHGVERSSCHVFPIVGIGCSAGGLEALEAFFTHVPADSGMAFVVIQHLDPDHASQLPEILQRSTSMVVAEAGDGMVVYPNRVYVIPPNTELTLRDARLYLLDPSQRRGLRLPIDFFLRALAEDRRESAVGVILSGMGSDGMLGLGAIKEKSGLTLAQEPTTAQADSMPNSAIKAGFTDIVAPPAELPVRIADYFRLAPLDGLNKPHMEAGAHSNLGKIITLLHARTGNDFSLYKPNTLYRRIERRISMLQIAGIANYLEYLRENPQEVDLLFKEFLIGVTQFFRDPALWKFLQTTALPELLAKYPQGRGLRCWVPACSSGEEAYSLAILFKELLEQLKPDGHFTLQIYATDLDVDAIDRARHAFYPGNIVADVPSEWLSRYFTLEGSGYKVHKAIRQMVTFAPHNVIADPPFSKLDLLLCRNLLIYFGSELQKRLLPLFHYSLNPDGILVLGSAETVGNFTDIFAPMDQKTRVFRRIDRNSLPNRLVFPAPRASSTALPLEGGLPAFRDSLEYQTDHFIQQNYAPAAVLVTRDGDILYISGRTGKYLEPAAGKINVNIHAMAREGLRDALIGAIRGALRQSEPIHLNGLSVATDGGKQIVNVTVQGIESPEVLRGRVLVVFSDVRALPAGRHPRMPAASNNESALARELQQLRESLRITQEEMQASLEEARSANEELQATNEELTTSKEELQSMNEELQTVNAELHSKVDDLTWARNDMTNLLNSTEVAAVFLDNEMKLRRFTTHATHLFKFIPSDVGRLLSDIATDLDYPQLKDDALAVLAKLAFIERQASTTRGSWYRVRIMPYRTQEDVIDGVVITFIDITEIKQLEGLVKKGSDA